MSFRYKPNKIKYLNDIITLDSTHKSFINKFQANQDKLQITKNTKEQLLNELKNLDINDDNYINKKGIIKRNINILEEHINDTENHTTEINYYNNAGDYIMDYYEDVNIDEIINTKNTQEDKISKLDKLNIISKSKRKSKKITRKRIKQVASSQKNVLDYFNNDNITNNTNDTDNKNDIINNNINNKVSANTDDNTVNNIVNGDDNTNDNTNDNALNNGDDNTGDNTNDNALNNAGDNAVNNVGDNALNNVNDNAGDNAVNKRKNKASIFENYMKVINNYPTINKNKYLSYCTNCNIDKTLIPSDGIFVCTQCAEFTNIIIESDIPNFKDQMHEKPTYPYKRINHFCEWIAQFQAKESTEIPSDVYIKIIEELKKNRITDTNQITIKTMKYILKKLRLHNYYEHIPHIISKITNKPPPMLDRDTEETLKIMFKKIQAPFAKYCPANRINFLSYSYVLHKLCELLELDDFLKCFPLLKSKEKLRTQDQTWHYICKDLRWQFIPSI